MSKLIGDQHIIGELGVNVFETYCLKHAPPLLFRPERVNDFGIDGEVEITDINSSGKTYATGEIIKVQIKSTKTGSYIHKETNETFDFHANNQDIEYWNRHKLDVVLVIYDARNDLLYAKKIDKVDSVTKKTRIPVIFNKSENRLIVRDNCFREKFSAGFKSRIDFSKRENIILNLFKFSTLPKYLYSFDSRMSSANEIFSVIKSQALPVFRLEGKTIFTFYDPKPFKEFCEKVIDYKTKTQGSFKHKLLNGDSYRICIELLNVQFKEVLYDKRIVYNKKYERYFYLPSSDTFDEKKGKFLERKQEYRSKKGGSYSKTLVNYYTYGKNSFFRHLAFETKPKIINNELYLTINPKYLFTSDGRNPLTDTDLITKLTNYLTAREMNQTILNTIHFIYSSLSDRSGKVNICEMKNAEISLSKYITEQVGFSIPLDQPTSRIKPKANNQINIFPNED